MDLEALNMIITLVVNLSGSRMELKCLEFVAMLNTDKKIDRKESETLIAGYKKALKDMNEVFMSIGEM